MLNLLIEDSEFFDEKKSEFITIKATTLQLEHSLVSLSKWESRWNKPFLLPNAKTIEETIYYIQCMTLTQNVNSLVYSSLKQNHLDIITAYIEAPMTATTFSQEKKNFSREIITSEVIYYWMIALNIPFECQKWHLNRLLTLINVCNLKSKPPKKMGRKELMDRNRALNAARRNQLNTSG